MRVCVCDTYVCIVCTPNKLSLFLFLHVHNPHTNLDRHALYSLSHTYTPEERSSEARLIFTNTTTLPLLCYCNFVATFHTPEEWSSEPQRQAPRVAPQPPKTCMYPRHWLTKCFDGICVIGYHVAPRGEGGRVGRWGEGTDRVDATIAIDCRCKQAGGKCHWEP